MSADGTAVLEGLLRYFTKLDLSGEGTVDVRTPADHGRFGWVDIRGTVLLRSSVGIEHLRLFAKSQWQRDVDATYREVVPRLDIAADAAVRDASGPCVLQNLTATIHGSERIGLAVIGLQHAESEPGGGQLKNVDVSHLSAAQLRHLETLRVLEISGRSLKRYANEGQPPNRIAHRFSRNSILPVPLSHYEICERAETAAELVSIVGRKVNSGNSRAWLHWCVARLQHRALNKRSLERPFRFAFRLVGYGYRPGPAVLTWVVTAIAGWLYGLWGGAAEGFEYSLDGASVGRFIEILFAPIGYLNLFAAGESLTFEPTSANLVLKLVIGLAFLFVILGARQFFRSPVRSGSA